MRLPRPNREAVYDDLYSLPENCVGEIIDGELWVSPRPRPRHAKAHSRLVAKLGSAFDLGDGGPGGWMLLAEPEVKFDRSILVPDIAGWRRTRLDVLPETNWFAVVPDLVCEVLSPSTCRLDRQKKMAIYARYGVPNAWLVDPIAQTIESYELANGRYFLESVSGGDSKVRIPPFAELELDLTIFWEGPPAPSRLSEPETEYVMHDLREPRPFESLR